MNVIAVLEQTVNWLFNILRGLLLVRVLLSWMPMFQGRIVSYVFALTEPILAPIRKVIMRSPLGGPGMMLDFSPIIAFFLMTLGQSVALNVIAAFG